MTKLKEFRETAPDWMKISMLDVLEMIDSSKTNKFLPMLTQIINSRYLLRVQNNNHEIEEYKRAIVQKIPTLKDKVNTFDKGTLFCVWHILEQIHSNVLETMLEFMESYEKNQINNVDINNLKEFHEVERIVNLISLKNLDKEYSKQISVELNTEKWLVVRPLTYESSVKYGASTRWCTAAKHNPHQFFRYTEGGVLIYCINRETGVKTAFHSWIESETKKSYDVSFWNSADDRIDSLLTDLDPEVMDVLKKIITSSEVESNKEIGGEFWTKSHEINDTEEKLSDIATPVRELHVEQAVDYAMEAREVENRNVFTVYTWGDATVDEDALSDYEVVTGN